ncbi:UpsA domain-containing protein [Natrinema pellirubrum DSM 15624]|uniref:Universal stress protein UspA-like protein n=1 Tax=Natrinema pellirubrum (strain DSM 15624 / CIP 106293 / JCM 10476 / NCIMB 786 / 157) TaxID=797303 RepID=L0JMZ0_NATP1|nr:universal stress protein [Natrinema pellirubrum]AGB31741.1 universal stress protein UspA-like protein [Natrinema pellirubrum DSM 15624]ELY72775.1 UpsA domain-containing protein [Natrinema pellirubrum DSM 15624]
MVANNDIGYERVLVPVGDKSDPNMLTQLSSILVDPRRGAVRFTHVTTDRSFVGSQENWRTGSESVAESQHTLREEGIESTGTIRTASSALDGILEEFEEYDADAILIGWTDKDSVSNLVDRLLRKANCDVIVFSADRDPIDTDSILVPVVVPPDENRLQMLAIMSQRTEASVTFAYIAGDEGSEADGRELLDRSVERLGEYGVQAETQLASSVGPVEKLGELSADHDIMVIGTSRGWWLRQSLFGRKTDKIASEAQCSILMHKWQGEVPPDN